MQFQLFAYSAKKALATTAYGKKSLLLDNAVIILLLLPCNCIKAYEVFCNTFS